ncbi:phosphomevalonate kinase [Actinomortierella ambigua]|uniref:Phosphomevalonate kinase n=1 Tax=Actinomortierella ambigua TaxID=1343610 RepID=A0A9P6Q1X8_9FUNG|nr:phosphomevalonate kinase [Actinomortierella ambigua]
MPSTTIVSAPGKVLIAGGYLVLDRAFEGLVVATDARFFTMIHKANHKSNTIRVVSPQFENSTWHYTVNITPGKTTVEQDSKDSSKNPFVHLALKISLAILGHTIPHEQLQDGLSTGLDIFIAGDNDFYSQREELQRQSLPLTSDSLRQIRLFSPTYTTLGQVHKTGLGSSAALMTSLVAALFSHFGATKIDLIQHPTDLQYIHNIAQYIHCFAQGKVGSGFDVSSAVYGSHQYLRFSPSLIEALMTESALDHIDKLYQTLDPRQTSWDNFVDRFQLPPQFQMVLADIDAGSHTPSMASKVLRWRKAKPEEADGLWAHLGRANDRVAELMRRLTKMARQHPLEYELAITKAAGLPASQWESLLNQSIHPTDKTASLLLELHRTFETVRKYLREMSVLADVPIEPEMQTRLLDACLEANGVLMAGVPGAGGFDAIFCIVLSDESRQAVEKIWAGFKEMSVGPLLCSESIEGGLVLEHVGEEGETAQAQDLSPSVQRLFDLYQESRAN